MIVGIIPARYASTRFPGKLLADLHGQSVLERTWRRATGARLLDRLIIAAGDEKIAIAARNFSAEVVDIFKDCASGSDRIAEAIVQIERNGESFDIVVNIQGDEPLIKSTTIDKVIERLKADPQAGVTTPVTPIKSVEEYNDPSVVKVVLDTSGHALYFSRAPIPYGWDGKARIAYRHIGLYAYRRDVLMDFTKQPPCLLELTEQLEQLRLLYNDVKVSTIVVEDAGMGVDTENDLEQVKNLIKTNRK